MRIHAILNCFILCFLCSGCLWNNHRRAESDGMARVYLSRSFVVKNSQLANPEGYVDPWSWDCSCNFDIGRVDDPRALLVIPIVLGVAALGAVMIECVDSMVSTAPSTYAEIWPAGHASTYRQFLYWGNNYFYYPESFKGEPVPVIVRIYGDRNGQVKLLLDVSGEKSIRLKR